MKIYTKTGDEGQTGLIGGRRIAKNSRRISAIGDVDELNAAIGVARLHAREFPLDEQLAKIQGWLFEVGAELASPEEERFATIGADESDRLEVSIDEQTGRLPELRNFILPGGSPLAAHLHFARSVCRRAERSVLALHETEPVRSEVRVLLNRLADWFFVTARTANHVANVHDMDWKRGKEQ